MKPRIPLFTALAAVLAILGWGFWAHYVRPLPRLAEPHIAAPAWALASPYTELNGAVSSDIVGWISCSSEPLVTSASTSTSTAVCVAPSYQMMTTEAT